jgi:hypothetical protein
VIRYPNAFFEGVFPFHVYVKHEGNPVATPAPITDYHDTRILYAASHGWDASATNAWLNELQLDPQWIRDNAEASLRELARREADMPVQLTQLIRPKITDSFHTINHPINELVVEVVRQVLEQLGYADADRVLSSHQTDLEHVNAPREPQILRALGTEPSPSEPTHWRTPAGEFSMDQIVDAHLALFAADPALLASGLVKHKERLEVLHA